MGLNSWESLKSYKHKQRKGRESEHRKSRLIDDVYAIKFNKLFGIILTNSFERSVKKELSSTKIVFQGKEYSIVIPFGNSDGTRLRLLIPCLERINELLPEAEIVLSGLIEERSFLESQLKNIKKIKIVSKIQQNKDFNIAAAINSGVSSVSRKNICIMQADIYLSDNIPLIMETFEKNDKDYYFPCIGVMFLNRESTEKFLSKREFKPRLDSYCRELESYFLLLKKDSFEKIGGYYEEFTESGEDNDFYDRLAWLESVEQRVTAVYHLWHPPFWKNKAATSNNNRELLKKLKKIPLEQRIKMAINAYLKNEAWQRV